MKRRSNSTLPTRSDIDATPSTGVKSAVRVMQVLEFFDQIQRDASVSEIVENLGFPQSSTSALLKSLVQTGYLDYLSATRSYLPTPRVALLGSWIGGSPMRDGSVGRMMDALSAETGDTILLASRNGIYAKYIHVIQATNAVRLHVPPGAQRLLASSTIGVPLLSDEPDETIRLLVKRTNAESPAGQKSIDVRQTLERVDRFRKLGYFFSPSPTISGAGMICMRLPSFIDSSGRPLAIGIGGPLSSLQDQEEHLARLMNDALHRYIDQTALM